MSRVLGERLIAVLQPVMFTWAAIINLATSLAADPDAAFRSLAVGALIALAAFGLSLLLTRSWTLATLLASGFMLFTVRQTLAGLAMLTFAVWWLLVLLVRRYTGRRAPNWALPQFIARATGIFSIALVAVAGWGFASAVSAGQPEWNPPSYSADGSGGPNVYVILLDGYPRADTLQETFGIDNTEFTADLEDRGFTVSDGARANYNKTWLTLASMFNGSYVDRMLIDGRVPEEAPIQVRWLAGMIERAAMLDAFRDRGYLIRTVPTPFTSTALTSADEIADVGGLTEVEARLISLSPWAQIFREPVLDFLVAQQLSVIDRSLELTAAFAEVRADQPQLLFSHIHSPHTPFVLHPGETEPAPLPECLPTLCSMWSTTTEELGIGTAEFADAMELQLDELNRLVLEALDRIQKADPDAVVVLFSDHGIRYSLEDLDEHYRVLLAARTPDGETPFADNDSPVNILRGVLARLVEGVEPLEYERWDSDWVRIMDMERAE